MLGKRIYYRCAHAGGHGPDVDQTELKERHRVSKKVHTHCPASMTAFERSGKVSCTAVFHHAGHEQRTALLPLPHSVEEEIKRLLSEGLTPQQIVEKVQRCHWDAAKKNSEQSRACYVTLRDIQDLSSKHLLMSGRRDSNDIVSFEILIKEYESQTGPFHYQNAVNNKGDGFRFAALLPGGKEALEKYGRRGLVFDDTFHTTTYNFRLATLIVLDHSDNGIPVGIVISNKMTSDDAAQLFHVIKDQIVGFKTNILMSDDTLVFWNAYKEVFGESGTRKLLCSWHIGQTIGRRVPELITDPLNRKLALRLFKSLMRITNKTQFLEGYDRFLTWLMEQKENKFLEYMEKNYSTRLSEWAPCFRVLSPLNTSMHAESFHAQLKVHVLHRKQNSRLDTLFYLLMQHVQTLSMKRATKDSRLLLEGNSRQSKNIQRHRDALKYYQHHKESIEEVGPAYWVVKSRNGSGEYNVQVLDQCQCDPLVNNHCPQCGVCAYSFTCTCSDSVQSGVCCVHRHAVVTYSSGSHYCRKPSHALSALQTEAQNTDREACDSSVELNENDDFVDDETVEPDRPESSRHDEVATLLQQQQTTSAAYHQLFLTLSKDVSNLPALKEIQEKQNELYNQLQQLALDKVGPKKGLTIARREVVCKQGRPPTDTIIRKFQSRGVILRKRNEEAKLAEQKELEEVLQHTRENVSGLPKRSIACCGVCHRRNPPGQEGTPVWYICDNKEQCGVWLHSYCNELGSPCTVCRLGNARKIVVNDHDYS